MNTIHSGVLTLIKSAITGESYPLPETFTLADAGRLIHKQEIWTLIYLGACNCGFTGETEIIEKLKTKYYRLMMHSQRQMAALEQVMAAFRQHGIEHMPLKGINLKKLYPHPELRPMGDGDILIRVEQYPQIKPILEKLGFQEKNETQHELTWQRPELYLELHKCLFAQRLHEYYSYYGDGWKLARAAEESCYHLQPEDEFVYLFTHMAKHYRFTGIGIQHILDLYIYRRAYPDMDENRIEQTMRRLYLTEFYHNIMDFLAFWFDGREPDEKTELMLHHILSGGSWGEQENKFYSNQVKRLAQNGKRRGGKLEMILDSLFPSMDRMQCRYRVLFHHKWLYPVFVVVRWMEILLRRPKSLIRRLRKVNQVDDEKVELRRQTLEAVGLGFHFAGEEE